VTRRQLDGREEFLRLATMLVRHAAAKVTAARSDEARSGASVRRAA
jgi:hypothetical protein